MKRTRAAWVSRLPVWSRRAGQSMVEFAMALPLFIIVLLAIVDIGRIMVLWTGISAGAREGARMASLPGPGGVGVRADTEIRQAVGNFVLPVSSPTFDQTSHVRILCYDLTNTLQASCAGRTSNWTVQVLVVYPFGPLPPFSAPLGAFSSFGASPFTTAQCSTSYAFGGLTFAPGGEAGCIILTAESRGRVE